MSDKYPKIDGLFKRGDGKRGPGTGKLMLDTYRNPLVTYMKYWDCYEKIDGMNMRVIFKWESLLKCLYLSFKGRTDKAEVPKELLEYMRKVFTLEKIRLQFPYVLNPEEEVEVTLYGEGYGPGIQKGGGRYCNSKRFRLFDVKVNDTWLNQDAVKEIAKNLGIKTAPYLGRMTLDGIIAEVRRGFISKVAMQESEFIPTTPFFREAEGIVARTKEPLFDKRGKRVIFKLKTTDFHE